MTPYSQLPDASKAWATYGDRCRVNRAARDEAIFGAFRIPAGERERTIATAQTMWADAHAQSWALYAAEHAATKKGS
jgi:hypothetical protein